VTRAGVVLLMSADIHLRDSHFFKTCYLKHILQEKETGMKEIFQEYGGILITVIAIVALLVVIKVIVGTDATGTVGLAFKNLINNFVSQATTIAGS
jgi:small-conductance mechanosensitive channel